MEVVGVVEAEVIPLLGESRRNVPTVVLRILLFGEGG